MNDRNSTYRKSFTNVEETSEEYEKKLQLEEQLRVATDKLKYKKRQMKELQEDLRTMQATAESLTVDENELVVIVEEKQRTIDRYKLNSYFGCCSCCCIVKSNLQVRRIFMCAIFGL